MGNFSLLPRGGLLHGAAQYRREGKAKLKSEGSLSKPDVRSNMMYHQFCVLHAMALGTVWKGTTQGVVNTRRRGLLDAIL